MSAEPSAVTGRNLKQETCRQLSAILTALGIGEAELAERLGISRDAVAQSLRIRASSGARAMSLETVARYARALDCEVRIAIRPIRPPEKWWSRSRSKPELPAGLAKLPDQRGRISQLLEGVARPACSLCGARTASARQATLFSCRHGCASLVAELLTVAEPADPRRSRKPKRRSRRRRHASQRSRRSRASPRKRSRSETRPSRR